MAGAVLTQSERELAQMGGGNALALKTAKGQLKETRALNADLRAKMARMQEGIDKLQSQRDTAEAQIARLMDDLDRLTRERDNALTAVLAKDAEIGALAGKLAQAQAVVDAARAFRDDFTYDDKTKTVDQWADNPYLYNDLIALRDVLAAHDAAQTEAKP